MHIICKFVKVIFISSAIYFTLCMVLIYWPIPVKQDLENYDFSSLEISTSEASMGEERHLTLRDGLKAFYRYYDSSARDVLILIHGSGGESRYFSALASFMAETGMAKVLTPDLRGHGRTSEVKGDIEYLGQYDHDLEDIINATRLAYPESRIVLGGHSSGGGLVLRYAGNKQVSKVDGYLLFSPYLGHKAPTVKPNSGDWVTVAIKRWVGLSMLNNVNVTLFNHLPVLIFNLSGEWTDDLQTPSYSYRLATSFAPNNYIEDIKKIDAPMLVLVGEKDEGFYAEEFAPIFRPAAKYVTTRVIKDAKHLDVMGKLTARAEMSQWFKTVKAQ